jgi:hypothetical protein
MRNSAADGEMPTCVLDIKFDHNDTEAQEWAATIVQAAWKLWRERMGLLVLLHGLADFDVRCRRMPGHDLVQYHEAPPGIPFRAASSAAHGVRRSVYHVDACILLLRINWSIRNGDTCDGSECLQGEGGSLGARNSPES